MKKINVLEQTQVKVNCETCLHLSKQDDLYICTMTSYDVDMSATLLFDKECESYKLNHNKYFEITTSYEEEVCVDI